MSRTTRGNARRRIAYLATSSFVATSLLTAGAVLTAVLTPTVALASPLPLAAVSVDLTPLVNHAIELAGSILALVASWAVAWVAQKLAAKFHVQGQVVMADEIRKGLDRAIAEGTNLATQEVDARLKPVEFRNAVVGYGARYLADHYEDYAARLGLDDDKLVAMVSAHLPPIPVPPPADPNAVPT